MINDIFLFGCQMPTSVYRIPGILLLSIIGCALIAMFISLGRFHYKQGSGWLVMVVDVLWNILATGIFLILLYGAALILLS